MDPNCEVFTEYADISLDLPRRPSEAVDRSTTATVTDSLGACNTLDDMQSHHYFLARRRTRNPIPVQDSVQRMLFDASEKHAAPIDSNFGCENSKV